MSSENQTRSLDRSCPTSGKQVQRCYCRSLIQQSQEKLVLSTAEEQDGVLTIVPFKRLTSSLLGVHPHVAPTHNGCLILRDRVRCHVARTKVWACMWGYTECVGETSGKAAQTSSSSSVALQPYYLVHRAS